MIVTTPPDSVPYYYGYISRENAELILFDRGCMDGMYLLRSSHGPDAGGFVLSLCHAKQVVHYRIIKDEDGLYYLSGMTNDKYAGPIELIQNVPQFTGFLTIPCLKPLDVFMPGVNCSVSEVKLKEALRNKSTEWGIQEVDFGSVLDDKQSEVFRLVLKTLHECEPWFHGRISREESEARLIESELTNGKFLVRERDPCSFTLSLCHESQIKHYKIDVLPTGEVGIQDGPRFENIISLISHYSVFSDGLWCQLQQPCVPKNNCSASLAVVRAEEIWSSNGASIYPVLTNEDAFDERQVSAFGVGQVKSPPPPTTAIKSSNRKGASTWFINHLPKLNKDKSPQASVQPLVAAKSNKVPKSAAKNSKLGKLTKMDISSPVITRPAPPPPTNKNATDTTQLADSDFPVSNGICFSVQNELSASTQVPIRCPLSAISTAPTTEDTTSNRRPLPAPRLRRILPVPVQVTIDSVPPSPLSPKTPCNLSGALALEKSSTRTSTHFTYPPLEVPTWSKHEPKMDEYDPPPPDSQKVFQRMKNVLAAPNMMDVIEELKGRSSKSLPPVDSSEIECQPKSDEIPHYEEIDPVLVEIDPVGDENGATHATVVTEKCSDSDVGESLLNPEVENTKWDNTPDKDAVRTTKNEQGKPPWTKEESEFHFKTIRRYRKGPTAIDRKNLLLQEKIGVGNFGDVVKAVFKSGQVQVPCAIKTLRQEAISSGKEDILREARIMTKLDHAHIVRLFGISEGDPFLLVMELAPLGPLNSYVRKNLDVSPRDILLLLYQVALGMEYLESKQFVHRDLAARNVLLVNDSFAKISDFGMSRALGLHSDYYRVEPQAKLPLKWYAPECIYYFRFSCKSDVWSYGITMWEALSYGERPYQGLTGHEILTMFNTNRRLACPETCSPEMYAVMWKCWQFRPDDRPSFSELKCTLRDYLNI